MNKKIRKLQPASQPAHPAFHPTPQTTAPRRAAPLLLAGSLTLAALHANPLAAQPASSAATPKPNIVLILVDDMGYGDIGPFGSTKNRTPNLDRMAAEGLKLTSFYCAPVCTPSRAQMMTGCYAKRVSLGNGVLFPAGATGLSPKEHTVADLLKAQGYATMAIGKWHLGDQPEFLPTHHGFDAYFGLPYSNDMDRPPNAPAKNHNPPLPLVSGDKPIEVITPDKQAYLESRYTDAALKFIHEHANAAANGHPFFLYLAHTAVHYPIHPGPNFRGKSANGRYGDWIEEMDWSTGRVLDTLRDLNLAANTLVFFTSDNGPWAVKGSDAGTAAPLRGAKGGTYEGGMRESTLAWWPGKIPAGATNDAVTGNIDILPTLVALAGGTIPADNKIDGVDISPILLGKATQSTRKAQYYFDTDNNTLQAVRSGPWKLAISRQHEKTKDYKLNTIDPNFTPTLYNLDTDIGETKNVAAEHPDIVAQLQVLIDEMDKDLGKSKAPGPGVRPPGRVANPVGLWLPGQRPSKETLKEHYD